MKSPYSIIEGKYPTWKELSEWSENHWITFLTFADFFIVIHPNSESWTINMAKIEEMETYLDIPNHPYHEFIFRVGQWKKVTTPIKFKKKLQGMTNHSLRFFKNHPAAVSEAIKLQIERHPTTMAWCLKQFDTKETAAGEIVTRDNTVATLGTTRNVSLPSLQAQIMTATLKIADLVSTIAGSISDSQLRSMDTDDKLKHLARLVPILTQIGKAKMGGNSFTQINLNGGVKDLEQEMLAYVTQSNKDNL